MKLSQADFRPRQRAGFVASGPRRKNPLLRVLFLFAFGALIYFGFDTLWPWARQAASGFRPSMAFKAISPPPAQSTSIKGEIGPVWNSDGESKRARLDCSGAEESACCLAMENIWTGMCGEARFVVEKNRREHSPLHPARLLGVEVLRPQEGGLETRPQLATVSGVDGLGSFHFLRNTMDKEASTRFWCDSARGCLVDKAAQPPMRRNVASGPLLDREGKSISWTASASEVFPVLKGRVTSVEPTPLGYRVTLYHGKELYSRYEPLLRIANGVLPGAPADPRLPLGDAAQDSSGYTVRVGFERAGLAAYPSEFFTLGEDG